MSLEEYERFVYGACHVDDEDDPVAHWRGVAADLERARAGSRERAGAARSSGPTPTCSVGVAGRKWIAADGRSTCPTARSSRARSRPRPRARSASASRRSSRAARSTDVRLRFEGGRSSPPRPRAARTTSLAARDRRGRARARRARVRPQLRDRPLHPQHPLRREDRRHDARRARLELRAAGGQNHSALHWDMICDLRAEGEVYADGELVWKDGPVPRASRPQVERWLTRASSGSRSPRRLLGRRRAGRSRRRRGRRPSRRRCCARSTAASSRAGGHPACRARADGAAEILLRRGQRRAARLGQPAVARGRRAGRRADHRSTPTTNTRACSDVDPARQARAQRAREASARPLPRARRRGRAALGR